MRNPWLDFESVALGKIFQKHGGGGHQRVASTVLPIDKNVDYKEMLRDIIAEIFAEDAAASNPVGASA
jgi:nanoRNase/pAp phosphatase (c-di-AMP/oligoRNAs hydrolase)